MITTLLRGEDVAQILSISRSQAFTLIRRGEIPALKIGRSVRVREADLMSYVAEHVAYNVEQNKKPGLSLQRQTRNYSDNPTEVIHD